MPLAACDSLHYIRGEAPLGGDCEIRMSEVSEPSRIRTERVQGTFAVRHIAAGGPLAPDVKVAAYCDGIKVREETLTPTDGDIQLGTLAP
jgi:hypothetical protein